MTINNISNIQKKLRELKLYNGKIDNIKGEKTTNAIMIFQKLHPPLKIDGIVGKKTEKLLFPKNITLKIKNKIIDNPFPTYDHITNYYGKIGDKKQLGKVTTAYPLKLAWNEKIIIRRFTCHKKLINIFQTMFENILKHYGQKQIELLGLNLFGGCYNIRKMRRSQNKYSTHSWGIAIDIDPKNNQLLWKKNQAKLAKPQYQAFWQIINELKLISLGQKYDFDWMHIQAAQ